jgi:hypothetical protein
MLRFMFGLDPFVSSLFIANLSRSRIPLTKLWGGVN